MRWFQAAVDRWQYRRAMRIIRSVVDPKGLLSDREIEEGVLRLSETMRTLGCTADQARENARRFIRTPHSLQPPLALSPDIPRNWMESGAK